ncbi:coiled-coil domain-containing protein 134-like [Argonauta hians]
MPLPVKTSTMVVHKWMICNVYLILNITLLGLCKHSISSTDDLKNNEDKNIATYQKLFRYQRNLQKEAINHLFHMNKVNQYKFTKSTLEEIFKILKEARSDLTKWGYLAEDPFPSNTTVRNSLSQVLEKTALFSDVMLKLPDVTHDLFDKNDPWRICIAWCIVFCQKSKIYDQVHQKMLAALSQELEFVPRDPSYSNPYRKTVEAILPKEVIKPKKKQKKGPKLSQNV